MFRPILWILYLIPCVIRASRESLHELIFTPAFFIPFASSISWALYLLCIFPSIYAELFHRRKRLSRTRANLFSSLSRAKEKRVDVETTKLHQRLIANSQDRSRKLLSRAGKPSWKHAHYLKHIARMSSARNAAPAMKIESYRRRRRRHVVTACLVVGDQ